jgi:hypothetical protein
VIIVYSVRVYFVTQAGTPSLNLTGGPWNDFRTSHPLAVSQFECWGRFGGVNTDDESGYSYLVLSSLPGGVAPVAINPFDTGYTSGYGISAGVGRLQLRWESAATAEHLR